MSAVTFGQQALAIHQQLQSSRSPLHDMRTAVSLEDRLGDLQLLDEPNQTEDRAGEIEWIEPLTPFARPVERIAGPTPIRYFLDGSQKTFPGYHVSAVPLLASVTASGILERRSPVDLQIAPAMLGLRKAWLVPLRSELPAIRDFISAARATGIDVIDPLEHLEDEATYQRALDDFIGLEMAALAASRRLRRQGETELLERWTRNLPDGESWLIVDGALREPATQTIGLVKSFNRQYIIGDDADQLFRLPAGHRTPVFRVADRRHGGSYAVWYLRFHQSEGRDPRYGLVRVETAYEGTPLPFDLLSSWILDERSPRASNDARWPTLIYPIHYLEQILKNYLAREVRFWPGTRGAG